MAMNTRLTSCNRRPRKNALFAIAAVLGITVSPPAAAADECRGENDAADPGGAERTAILLPSPADLERIQRGAGRDFSFGAVSRRAVNAPSGMQIDLGHGRARVALSGHEVRLALNAVGRTSFTRLPPASPTTEGNVGEYVHASVEIDEWFVNGPLGLEHGFDVRRRPPGEGRLELHIEVGGSLRAERIGDAIGLVRSDGEPVLRYGLPFARDAEGRRLDIRLEARGRRIVITVDDAEAAYPIHVDPLLWRVQDVAHDSVPSESDSFGTASLSLEGDRLAAGGLGSEAVSVYRRVGTTWALEQRITSPLGTDEGFGRGAVSLQGDTLVVGARSADTTAGADAGAVYVFTRGSSGWSLATRLVASDAAAGAAFGSSVAIDGDTLVASACRNPSPGAVYVFERTGAAWTESQRIVPSAAERRACWSMRVAIEGTRIAAGSPDQRDAAGTTTGALFVFERGPSGFTETATMVPDLPGPYAGFAESVDISGDLIAAGAPRGGIGAPGTAFVFRWNGAAWVQEVVPAPSDVAGTTPQFGIYVGIEGNRLAVGSLEPEPPMDQVGGVHVFEHDGSSWVRTTMLGPPTPSENLRFGITVALSGPTLAVAAHDDVGSHPFAGSVYVHTLRHTDGDACTGPDDCHSGFCVDGVCCDAECGGGALDDCMACSVAAGSAVDGVCGAVSAAAVHVCRPEAGACDLAEVCDGSSASCPVDGFVDSTVVCRDAVGVCDREERCSGTAAECPLDVFFGTDVVCRGSIAACDAEERCDGASSECPADVLASTETVCRPAAMPCDGVERCDGSSLECPADALSPDGASCSDGLACNGAEVCMDATCVSGAALECDDGDACTADSCAEPEGCVHERFCCMRDLECDDSDACTIDSCDGERCVHLPACDGGAGLDGGVADGGPTFATWNCGCRAAGEGGDPRAFALIVIVALALRRRSRVTRGGRASRS